MKIPEFKNNKIPLRAECSYPRTFVKGRAVRKKLKDKRILGLPVHDSVIVKAEHENTLREIMVSEYEAVMGFKPQF